MAAILLLSILAYLLLAALVGSLLGLRTWPIVAAPVALWVVMWVVHTASALP